MLNCVPIRCLSILRSLFVAFFFFHILVASAHVSADANQWIQGASENHLAKDRQWLQLLHIESSALSGFRSYVADAQFFLSPQGQHDPHAELSATIAAFFDKPQTQCRFIARKQWLISRLPGLAKALPFQSCDAYKKWREEINVEKVVLVFASSYLNSPSSMYGHTFLRFDPVGMDKDASLMSYALNFGATVSEEDNGLLYAYKGVAGGYPGAFASGPYLEKVKEYSRFENRDLWEYQLNLTEKEIDFMMAHIWELDRINFSYYFFDENCSYRLLELLEVARSGSELTRHFPNVAIPLDTVRVVDDAGMIDDVVYRPSNLTQLKFQISRLDENQRQLARQLSQNIAVADSQEYQALTDSQKYAVTHLAYGYLRYTKNQQERDAQTARRSFLLLRRLNSVAKNNDLPSPPVPVRPDSGHKTTLASIAAGEEDGKAYADLELRLSYHDLLDNVAGYLPGSSLNMGRVVVRQKESESLHLQQLDVLDITSLTPRDEFFQPLSWRVNAGVDRQWVNDRDELAIQTNAGAGVTHAVSEQGLFSALLTTRVEYNEGFVNNLDIAFGASLGFLLQENMGSSSINIDAYQFTDGQIRKAASIMHNYNIDRNSAVRIMFKHSIYDGDNIGEFGVRYRYYY